MSNSHIPEGMGVRIPAGMPMPTNPFVEFPEAAVARSIPERFEEVARTHPGRLAVKSARHELSYESLNRAADRLAAAIRRLRVPADRPVAFLLEPGAPQIVAILGILKAGRMYAALDASFFPPGALGLLLQEWQSGLLLTDGAHRSLANELTQGKIPIVNLDALDGPAGAEPGKPPAPDDPALILYTSGSTGRPKGVVHSQRTVLHQVRMTTAGMHISADDRLVLLFSCSFAGSVVCIFPALLNGAALLPYDIKGQGLRNLGRWLIDQQITMYASVTSLFRQFAGTLTGTEAFPRLRVISLGGEPVTQQDVELYRRNFGARCLLATGLGATETLSVGGQFLDKDSPVVGVWVPLGYPSPGAEVLVLDENEQPVGPGEVGEIAVRSRYLALGYWRDPELTRTAFRADAEDPAVRTYRTGDLGVLRPDGCLEYHGRKDFQAKVRGHRVDVAQIEAALLGVPGITEAIVMGREDGGARRLVAYVVPSARPGPTIADLRRVLRERLPGYMVPSAFVMLHAMPRTTTGKVDRQALPPPATVRPELAVPYERPGNPSEQLMAEAWERCLHVCPVGVHDNFFDLGGDSFLAVEMLLVVEKLFGRKLSPDVLLGGATVRHLARHLLAGTNDRPRLVEIQPGAPRHRLFFLHGDLFGGGLYCANLARHLGQDHGFVALNPHGMAGTPVPRTIDEMADDLLRALSALQPEGPLLLAGHCNGALVAFALAQQLHNQGRPVERLVLVAPPRLVCFRQPFWVSRHCYALPSPPTVRQSPADLSRVPPDRFEVEVLRVYQDASLHYPRYRYPGRMTVIQPQEDTGVNDWPRILPRLGVDVSRLPCAAVEDLDWRTMADEVDFRVVPGSHLTCVTHHVEALADSLRNALT